MRVRISRQQVAENRDRLLKVAADQFREHGIDGVGIADLTRAAGMSLGSFYGYFESKEHLVSETCARALTGTKDRIAGYLAKPGDGAVATMIDDYLSPLHRDSRAKGCALPALGSEITHQPALVRHAATGKLHELFDAISPSMPGETPQQKAAAAIATVAGLMGGVILSRMADDAALSQQILDAVAASLKQATSPYAIGTTHHKEKTSWEDSTVK